MAGIRAWRDARRSKLAQHQPVEARGESGRILRQFAVENLRLLKQHQRHVVGDLGIAASLGNGHNQGVAQIDLEDRLGAGTARLLRQDAFELPVRPLAAGDKA